MQYYIGIKGVQSGPFSEVEIQEKLAARAFPADALCWTEGWPEWRAVSTVFPPSVGTRPPTLPPSAYQATARPPAYVTPAAPPSTSGLAITSLILGLLGFVTFFTSIPAVICGHIACSQIKRSQGTQTGSGLAITGLVLGYIMIAFLPLMAATAIPAFQKVRSASQEKVIINNLRQLDAAAEQFMLERNTTKATYADLVGNDGNHYITSLHPVAGEDYTALVIRAKDREIRVTTAQGRVITLARHYTSPPEKSFAPVEAR